MIVLSLFDGISCGRVALERAGIKVEQYLASEIDKYAIQVAKKNYPDTVELGNVKDVWARNLPKIDLLIGGSPCQDLSITKSKTRKGLKGNKSILFWHYVRLLRTCKPKYFLFENVVSMKAEDKNVISKILEVQPIKINSALVSAQERERYYWTNIPNITQPADKGLVLKDILEDYAPSKYYYKYDLEDVNLDKQICAKMKFKNNEMHKRVFNPEFKVHTLTTCGGGNTQKKVYDDGFARKLMPIEYERLQTLPDYYTEGISDSRRYTAIGNGWTVDVIAHIFSFLPEEFKEKGKFER